MKMLQVEDETHEKVKLLALSKKMSIKAFVDSLVNSKSDEQYAEKLKNSMTGDLEVNHIDADDILLEALRGFGYEKLADEYEKQAVNFWYA